MPSFHDRNKLQTKLCMDCNGKIFVTLTSLDMTDVITSKSLNYKDNQEKVTEIWGQ